jgi:hypothetical protein
LSKEIEVETPHTEEIQQWLKDEIKARIKELKSKTPMGQSASDIITACVGTLNDVLAMKPSK